MGAARVLLKGSITGGNLVFAFPGFLKTFVMSSLGFEASFEKSWSQASGSSPAPSRVLTIFPSPMGFLNLRVGESFWLILNVWENPLPLIWPVMARSSQWWEGKGSSYPCFMGFWSVLKSMRALTVCLPVVWASWCLFMDWYVTSLLKLWNLPNW